MTDQQQPQGQQVQIKIDDRILRGFYSNIMQIMHTKEEFVLDFMNVVGQQGTLGSRVLLSPAHAKRILAALSENLKKYEEQFGTISEGESQADRKFGFQTQS